MSREILKAFVSKYSALLLDSDGTIGNTERVHAEIGARIMSQNGVPTSLDERFRMKGFGEARIWDEMKERGTPIQIPRQDFINAQTREFVNYIKAIRDPLQIRRPGILSLIEAFRDAGKRVAIISNTPTSAVEALKAATDLAGLIDMTITYDDITKLRLNKKPAPDGYNLARDLLSLHDNDRALIIEDSETGTIAGLKTNGENDVAQIVYNTLGERPIEGVRYVINDTGSIAEMYEEAVHGHSVAQRVAPSIEKFHGNVSVLPKRNLG